MIKDVEKWEAWERDYTRSTPLDPAANFAAFEAMLVWARSTGKFPPKDPLEGIERKVKLAEALRSV